jgi:predicted nucleic acid-binding protein
VTDVEVVRDRAERLLAVHAIRAADALQLAAALVLVREQSRGRDFVVADGVLAAAAEAEGFNVIVPSG